MTNSPPSQSVSGFLLIDKSRGITSHDVIDELRRITGIRKIGHAGTLDPFAQGLLICAVEREATKHLAEFVGLEKSYTTHVYLGATSDTYDRDGKIVEKDITAIPTEHDIQYVLRSVEGSSEQIPPMYSAKKVAGKKLYELARKGIEIERKPQHITVNDVVCTSYHYPHLVFSCTVSSGTYIRTLVHDIGQKLTCGAYTKALERTSIGSFTLDESIILEMLTAKNWVTHLRTYKEIERKL